MIHGNDHIAFPVILRNNLCTKCKPLLAFAEQASRIASLQTEIGSFDRDAADREPCVHAAMTPSGMLTQCSRLAPSF